MTHTIIPETIRFTQLNRKGAHPNISSVAVGPPGTLLFLSQNENSSSVFKARLHNPIKDITKISQDCKGDRIRYQSGLVFCYGLSSLTFCPVDKKFNPKFAVGSINSKKVIVEKLNLVGLPTEGTLAACKERLLKHQKATTVKYREAKCKEDEILFIHDRAIRPSPPNAITFIDAEALYGAFDKDRLIALCTFQFNSIGLESDCVQVAEYQEDWKNVKPW